MQVKCRNCGNLIDKPSAYFHLDLKGKNAYFCNEEHYNDFCKAEEQKVAEKQRIKEEKQRIKEEKAAEKAEYDGIFMEIETVIGHPIANYGAARKEINDWERLSDRAKIKRYLHDNRDELQKFMQKDFNSAFAELRYLGAIVKNKIMRWRPKAEEKENSKSVEICGINQNNYKSIESRRGLAFLEED